ncbi:MAG: hypothetical protein V8S99_12355 [Oscillospiraceae bacterium]
MLCLTAGFLLVFALWSICKADDARSVSERRALAQRPELTAKSVWDGTFMTKFETYTLDQFPLRDTFRSLKAHVQLDVLRQKDNNGIYVAGGYAAKLDYPLNEDSVEHALARFRFVYGGICRGRTRKFISRQSQTKITFWRNNTAIRRLITKLYGNSRTVWTMHRPSA